MSTILAGILLFPLIGPISSRSTEAAIATNYTNAELLGTESNVSSSTGLLGANPNVTINNNTTQKMNQVNNSNMTEIESASNKTVDFNFRDKNESSFLSNNITANITSSSNAAAHRASEVTADFNGDGFEDKAIGVPYEDVGSIVDAGLVHVIYGSSGGLSTTSVLPDQLLNQDSLDIGGIPEAHDHFGFSLSSGDYNGDGKDDLAIGVPDEDIDLQVATVTNFDASINSARFREDVGVVELIYGSGGGLSTTAVLPGQLKVFIQGFALIEDAAEIGDKFGWSLSSGDFNGDGNDDLAIGTPPEDIVPQIGGIVRDAGIIQVIYGSQAAGLHPNQILHDQVFTQGFANIKDVLESDDWFGYSLSSGDFNGDSKDDLAIGVRSEDIAGGTGDEGKVHVIYGSSSGLRATSPSPIANQLWMQGLDGLDDVAEERDFFGSSLTSGDYNGDGKDDLAIGVPDEKIAGETIHSAGIVHVLYGSSSGLSTTSPIADQLWQQGLNGLDDVGEDGDSFGWSLSSGDYNGDGKDDLAIGAFGESIAGETIKAVGKVHVIYGSSSGLSTISPSSIADQLWQQGLNGLDDVAEEHDIFGFSLSSGDYNGDGKHDLAIGAPFEKIAGETIRVGKVHVIYGSSSGLSTTSPIPDQLWQQGLNGLDDVAEQDDNFGFIL